MRVKQRCRRKSCAVSVGISTLPASSTSTTRRPEAARIPSVNSAGASAGWATMGPRWQAFGALARDGEAVGRTERKTTRSRQEVLQQEAPVGPERELVQLKLGGGGRTYAPATVSFPSLHRAERQEAECCVEGCCGLYCVQKRSPPRIAQERRAGCGEPGRKTTPTPLAVTSTIEIHPKASP